MKLENLKIIPPRGSEVTFEIHPERAKFLNYAGIIERDGVGEHILAIGITDAQKEITLALLDLNGDML